MSYSTYFEIGGHVIETTVDQRIHGPRPVADPLMELAKKHGVPKPLARKAMKESSSALGYDVARASQGVGRLRRAKRAFGIAAVLATADGPLPVGDAVAVGFLGAYGIYEVVTGIGDIVQN